MFCKGADDPVRLQPFGGLSEAGRMTHEQLGGVGEPFVSDEVRMDANTLARFRVIDPLAYRLDDTDTIGAGHEWARWECLATRAGEQFLHITQDHCCLDTHGHAAASRLGHGFLDELQSICSGVQHPRLHDSRFL